MRSATRQQEMDVLSLFERFIAESKNGKRLQPNGKRIGPGTIDNYEVALRLLRIFSETRQFELRIRPAAGLSKKALTVERNYWKKFYKHFTDFLYRDRGCFDNYVGLHMRLLKTFFNYLNKELGLAVGDFHKRFYAPANEIAIFPLMPEELNFLIFDKTFEEGLNARMRKTKDFFVFGCTVALRLSDLQRLTRSDLRVVNGQHYLAVRSVKTSTDTLVKLPPYAVEILQRYSKNKKLLPPFSKSNLNDTIKQLLELAGFTSPVRKTRELRGRPVDVKTGTNTSPDSTRFCDVATTHTMRRTAITTMLSLGAPEQVVRKISGHAPGSKEFYRYVLWSQTYLDRTTVEVFEKLEGKRLERVLP